MIFLQLKKLKIKGDELKATFPHYTSREVKRGNNINKSAINSIIT